MWFKLWEFIVNITEPILLFVLLKNKLRLKPRLKMLAPFAILISAVVTTLLNKAEMNYIILYANALIEYIIYSFVFFDGKVFSKIIWPILMLVVIVLSNSVVFELFLVISGSTEFLSISPIRVMLTVCYIILNTTLTYMLLCIKSEDRAFPVYIQVCIAALCILGCVALYILLNHTLHLKLLGLSVSSCIFFALTILTLVISILLLFDTIGKNAKKNSDILVELAESNAEREHNNQMLSVIDVFREFKHDYNGHITAISSYANSGDLEGLKKYIYDLNKEYDIGNYVISTGNKVIDSIITAKSLVCKNQGIDLDMAIFLPHEIPFSDVEFVSVISNLLDNAIEAQSQVLENKHIIFNIKATTGMLNISVINSSVGKYNYSDGRLTTSKDDSTLHGRGLRRINKIVSKNNGYMEIEADERYFKVQILVPISTL